jgi:fumarylacetoacetase
VVARPYPRAVPNDDLAALPYGVFSRPGERPRAGVAVGDGILDLSALPLEHAADFAEPSLNAFMARGRQAWLSTRAEVTDVLRTGQSLIPRSEVRMHLPFEVADYVDFYSSEHHATNVGRIFRPDGEPLPPNWRHLPIGYHGRAGTVVVSGTPIRRPSGPLGAGAFGPSQRLDIEAEVGFVVGTPAPEGRVATADFAEHVFGVVLVNDWSARDIQRWETVPLGPFLGKSFATSISPWVVPLAALEHARVAPPPRDPEPLPYLRETEPWGLDLELTVRLNGTVVSRPPFREMYWTAAQQLAHLTVNGASLRTGDLFASGTVSGPEPDQRGCLLELTWNGQQPLRLDDGAERTFLADGDEVVISAAELGEVSGRIVG